MDFIQIWLLGLINAFRAFDELIRKTAPMWGFLAVLIRFVGKECNFDQVLNIIGMGMLIIMPVVWLWDWIMIALNFYQMLVMAISHSIFALWGVLLFLIGLKRILGLKTLLSINLALINAGVYILLAIVFIR